MNIPTPISATTQLPFVKQAVYIDTGSDRYRGNPLIEALDPIPTTDQMSDLYEHLPDPPNDDTRAARLEIRRSDLNQLHDIVVLFPQYLTAGEAFHTMIREAYHYRNPFSSVGRQQRYAQAWAASGQSAVSNWKSTARGHIMMAISGMGKTTFANSTLLTYPPLIKHESYKGQPFNIYQIPIVTLRIPHDGTIRSLCVQFFEHIDRALGTEYAQQARRRVSIGPMIDLMKQVATAVSVGLLIIDEVQNLRTARSAQAEVVLNLFSEIIEKVGISILVIATPALENVIKHSVRNTRKLVSGGSTVIPPMTQNGPQWKLFTAVLWEYQYLTTKMPFTPEISAKWYDLSGGNSAFAALLFYMAQRSEMGAREYLDVASFERAYAANLSFLHPAIQALRSGNPDDLIKFDDLIVSKRWREIRSTMGVKDPVEPTAPKNEPEFREVEHPKDGKGGSGATTDAGSSATSSESLKAAAKPTTPTRKVEVDPANLKTEDPFSVKW